MVSELARVALIGWAVATLTVALPAPGAGATACDALPTSAQRARSCNPREECLRLSRKDLKAGALEAARADCERLPTAGTCFGPDVYNPQAECHAKPKR